MLTQMYVAKLRHKGLNGLKFHNLWRWTFRELWWNNPIHVSRFGHVIWYVVWFYFIFEWQHWPKIIMSSPESSNFHMSYQISILLIQLFIKWSKMNPAVAGMCIKWDLIPFPDGIYHTYIMYEKMSPRNILMLSLIKGYCLSLIPKLVLFLISITDFPEPMLTHNYWSHQVWGQIINE